MLTLSCTVGEAECVVRPFRREFAGRRRSPATDYKSGLVPRQHEAAARYERRGSIGRVRGASSLAERARQL